MTKDHETDFILPLERKSTSPNLEGKTSDSFDPMGVGPGLADPRVALSTSPNPKETSPIPSNPANGIFAWPHEIYANRPSSEGRARAKGAIPILTTLDATHTSWNDLEQ
jgi:hypothetical protein